ncbi:MAG: succinate dehydrogenase assembly factor 2 [Gammaproteobacteria bacterium]|nr:succinate dehydrogenase assembly factor 2 [Gammaproteobacteria bacterium]MDD9869324.1 succinate dehydrogenase assembly factor 2 [Gammaproteobacteria bacterium]MDD9886044.1 succinate dehydrogenase assembly factor 2 [Gammaproteobacteria bacterium]
MNAGRKRLYWLCRRGTRELDILMLRYLEQHYDKAEADERAAFEKLLQFPDPELYRLLTGHRTATGDAVDRVIRHIVQSGPD